MATLYFDLDNFGYTSKIHKHLTREFTKYNMIQMKFVGDAKQIKALPKEVDERGELILVEKKEGCKDRTDFRITIEIVEDLKKKDSTHFIVASHDKDYITIAEKVHSVGKKFGILLVHTGKSQQPLSPVLKEHCDVIFTLKDGVLHCEEKVAGIDIPFLSKDVGTQTDSVAVSTVEKSRSNLLLAWIDFTCKGYKRIAVELDSFVKQMEQNSKSLTPPLRFQAIHRELSNQLFWPPSLSCDCASGTKGSEQCPIFHLYRDGRVEREVIGPNLKELRREIKAVYGVVI